MSFFPPPQYPAQPMWYPPAGQFVQPPMGAYPGYPPMGPVAVAPIPAPAKKPRSRSNSPRSKSKSEKKPCFGYSESESKQASAAKSGKVDEMYCRGSGKNDEGGVTFCKLHRHQAQEYASFARQHNANYVANAVDIRKWHAEKAMNIAKANSKSDANYNGPRCPVVKKDGHVCGKPNAPGYSVCSLHGPTAEARAAWHANPANKSKSKRSKSPRAATPRTSSTQQQPAFQTSAAYFPPAAVASTPNRGSTYGAQPRPVSPRAFAPAQPAGFPQGFPQFQ